MLVFLKVPQMLVSLTTFPNFTNNVLRQVSQYLKKVMKFMTKLDKGKKNLKSQERQKRLLLIMLVYRKLSRQKAQRRRRQNLFILFSNLHYFRMKAIRNQRNAILSLLFLSIRERRYGMRYYNQLCFQILWNQRSSDLVKEAFYLTFFKNNSPSELISSNINMWEFLKQKKNQ